MTQLLLAARDGDHDALERFIRATQADVWRLCRHLGDPDTADDLAQETFERAIGALHRYRADGPARSWVLTIARRTCADGTRRLTRRRRLDARVADEHATGRSRVPGHTHIADERISTGGGIGRIEIDDLLERLVDDRREAFVLTQVLGLPYSEAAEVIGCPIGTVRSRVSRARADLLTMLAVTESIGDGTDG